MLSGMMAPLRPTQFMSMRFMSFFCLAASEST
jgi:hypothetical protein